MNTSKRRIVITGYGAVSPLGSDLDAIWQHLAAGRSGVEELKEVAVPSNFPPFGAEVRAFDEKKAVSKENRKVLKVMAADIKFAVGAAKSTLQHAGVERYPDPAKFGVNSGAGLIATEHTDLGDAIHASLDGRGKFDIKKWGREGMERMFPLWMLKYLPNMPACHISILYDAQGPNNSITASEASALLAIGEAHRVMARGTADFFLAGGTDSRIHPLSMTRLALLKKLTNRASDPQSAVRPFDAERDGFVPGEAAAFVALEEWEAARKRGAKAYAELLGFGSTFNLKDRADAFARSIGAALRDAGLEAKDLGLIVAHGSGAVDEDSAEQRALAAVIGAEQTPVLALKGYWGFIGAASGAMELVATLLAWQHRRLPASINFSRLDPGSPPINIVAAPTDFRDRPFLVVAASHSGQCAALVVKPLVA
jgi:3-oxoacyl-[acyl-carrier-protein] synthase II